MGPSGSVACRDGLSVGLYRVSKADREARDEEVFAARERQRAPAAAPAVVIVKKEESAEEEESKPAPPPASPPALPGASLQASSPGGGDDDDDDFVDSKPDVPDRKPSAADLARVKAESSQETPARTPLLPAAGGPSAKLGAVKAEPGVQEELPPAGDIGFGAEDDGGGMLQTEAP
jgi:hypothetical protein